MYPRKPPGQTPSLVIAGKIMQRDGDWWFFMFKTVRPCMPCTGSTTLDNMKLARYVMMGEMGCTTPCSGLRDERENDN
jgi:hypothetical protein